MHVLNATHASWYEVIVQFNNSAEFSFQGPIKQTLKLEFLNNYIVFIKRFHVRKEKKHPIKARRISLTDQIQTRIHP